MFGNVRGAVYHLNLRGERANRAEGALGGGKGARKARRLLPPVACSRRARPPNESKLGGCWKSILLHDDDTDLHFRAYVNDSANSCMNE